MRSVAALDQRFAADERNFRLAASATALSFWDAADLTRGGAVDQVVEAVDAALAGVRYELDLALVAGLEAQRRGGRNVEVQPERRGAVELQRAIDFEEMKVRAHLHRPVTGVAHGERGDRALLVEGDGLLPAHIAAHRYIDRCRVDIGADAGI